MLQIRIDIVNKKQYEELETYKEIKIVIPRSSEELKNDFRYLDLDYENYTIQDTHILECKFLDKEDCNFSSSISRIINETITRAKTEGYTTPFQDIIKLYGVINKVYLDDRKKLLAVLEAKEGQINNIKDAIKYAQNIDSFELIGAYDSEELARQLIYDSEIDIEDLMDYANLEELGRDYSEDKNMIKTEYGYLRQEDELEEYDLQKEEEEELE